MSIKLIEQKLPKYMVSIYCNIYGPGEIFYVNKISDIVQFIVEYVIYPSSIYKQKNFMVEYIPTVKDIENKIKEFYERGEKTERTEKEERSKTNISFGPKEILVYSAKEYHVTIKILDEIEVLNYNSEIENNQYYKNILQYIKYDF